MVYTAVVLIGTVVDRDGCFGNNHENDDDHPVASKCQSLSTTVLLRTAMYIHPANIEIL